MSSFVIYNKVLQSQLTEMLAAAVTSGNAPAGILNGAKVGLFNANINPTNANVLADFTGAAPAYTGYAVQAVSWLTPSIGSDGNVQLVGTVPEFRPSNGATSETEYGWYMTDSGGTNLLAAGTMPGGAKQMIDATSSLLLTIVLEPAIAGTMDAVD